ncbi:MAG: type IV pilus secretin PilQ [Acidobacteriota bacterium]|nr:type IV pilus secretin PilQ [Acidobacteriota bacterium]
MHGRIPRLVLAAPLAAALAVTLTASGPVPRGPGADTPALRSISSRLDGALSTVLIEASEPVAYLTSQPDPLTVLVDLRNTTAGSLAAMPIAAMLAPVAGVAIEGASAPDGAPVARVRVRLERAAKHRVRSSRNTILVEVDRGAAPGGAAVTTVPSIAPKAPTFAKAPTSAKAPAGETAGEPAVAKTTAVRAMATALRSITASEVSNGFAITLAGNGPLVASSVDETRDLPARVFLDFQGVTAGRAAPVTAVNAAGIERVRVATNSREPLVTRVVIDLARKLPYTVETVGEEIRVLFNRAVETLVPSASARESAGELRRDLAVTASGREGGPVAPPPPAPVEVAEVAASASAPNVVNELRREPAVAAIGREGGQAPSGLATLQTATNAQGQRTFTGDPITLDFQSADLRAVLRTFAEISGLNIVIDPSIQGTVDVSLRDVPWDQALDIILRANKLGYSVDGTIVRIVPVSVLAQETEDRKKLADASALAGELRVITRPLSYAQARDLVPIITKSALSPRGDVQIDTRTNTLIIRDLADRLQAASELIAALDTPQPQVEIEARIITLNRNFAKELGIQWGMNGRIDPSVGTTTGLVFPATAGAAATTGGVNLAAPSALGLALGSINGALNLDVQLRALENSGKVRIVSSPRVSTQNNIEAEITQGSQIPVQTISNNTVTVTFIPAALVLRVTPQITASGTVIMRIIVDKSAPNYSQTSAAQPTPSIDKQAAQTTVLVADGDTTVIGGIYNSAESSTQDRTPGLHRIPLIGWLFKNDTNRESQDELLIFITPKILK